MVEYKKPKSMNRPPMYKMQTMHDCGPVLIANMGYNPKEDPSRITLQSVKELWYDGLPNQDSIFADLCDSPVHHELTIWRFNMSVEDVTHQYDKWIEGQTGILVSKKGQPWIMHWVRFMGFDKENDQTFISIDGGQGEVFRIPFDKFKELMYNNFKPLKCAYNLSHKESDIRKFKWHWYLWFAFVQIMKKIFYRE